MWKREQRKVREERWICMSWQDEEKKDPEPRLRRAMVLLVRLRASLST